MSPAPTETAIPASSDGEEKILCINCVETVGGVYILCAEPCCKDTTLCLQCFSFGAELGNHLRGHDYHVRSGGGVPVFGPSSAPPGSLPNDPPSTSTDPNAMWRHPWSSQEERTLLDMVERFNLGNWEYIAEQVNPQRSAREVKEHYDKYYIRGRIGQVTNQGYSRTRVVDHSEPISLTLGLTSPPIRQSVCKLHPDDLRLLAYMPHRDDFEKEWNNDAETYISGLILMPDDDDLDKAVKLAQVDMYGRQVRNRRKRKALVRDYDLVPQFFKQERPTTGLKAWTYSPAQKKEMKLEKEYGDNLKKFAQFLPSQEFDQLLLGVVKEKMLKDRIEELQKFRKSGIQTLEEPLVTGNESVAGKRNLPKPPDKETLLSKEEKQMCIAWNLNVGDYLMLKVGVLREEVQKEAGVPMRTNLRQDTVEYKTCVKDFLVTSGWLSPFSST